MELSHPIQPAECTAALVAEAAQILKAGGLVAFPTETVYGLGVNAENEAALAKLYAVKGRPTNHPVIVHLASSQQLSEWAVDIPSQAYQLADAFWPGPLTLILKRSDRVLNAVTGGQETVGLRVPNHPVALALLEAFGGGIAAPSANRFGKLSPTQASHVQQDLGSDVDLILDGGPCDVGVESTIVAFKNGEPMVLRPGMITEADIAAVLNNPLSGSALDTISRVSGSLASHYAPRTPVLLLDDAELESQWLQNSEKLGVLSFKPCPPQALNSTWVQMPCEAVAYARQLYASLRHLDSIGLSAIWVETVPNGPEWAAIADRLQRAAAPH